MIGFVLGFIVAGSCWAFLGSPSTTLTRFPFGLVLFLLLPHCFVLEMVASGIDANTCRRPPRQTLIALACGFTAFWVELGALWTLEPSTWAQAIVWLVFPVASAGCLLAIMQQIDQKTQS
ncbi:MAG: hypothetical protein ACRC8S_10325 [Fimbriiglobus sp.]